MPIEIAIIDDHPLVIAGLKYVIDACDHITVMDTYDSGSALLTGLKQGQPDVLLLDLQLPDMSGKEIAEKVLEIYPQIKIIVLTSLEATHHIEEMMEIGCTGYLLKGNTDAASLSKAIESANKGIPFLDESLQQLMLSNIIKKKKKQEEATTLLTKREKEVLKLITEENTNQAIADKLYISVRTVECHRLSILHKLNVKNTAGIVKKAIELKLID